MKRDFDQLHINSFCNVANVSKLDGRDYNDTLDRKGSEKYLQHWDVSVMTGHNLCKSVV